LQGAVAWTDAVRTALRDHGDAVDGRGPAAE